MDGFSTDNYITDQDFFSEYSYRTIPSSHNGCGWIAAYNLRHYLGQDAGFDSVRAEMDEMHTIRVPGPTTMNVMRSYLKKYVPDAAEHIGRDESLAASLKSKAGILRFSEENIPHFICFIRSGDVFRFFNVNDGLEDFEQDMNSFFEQHCLRFRYTAVFTVQ